MRAGHIHEGLVPGGAVEVGQLFKQDLHLLTIGCIHGEQVQSLAGARLMQARHGGLYRAYRGVLDVLRRIGAIDTVSHGG